jgi:hypothetical protein
LDNILSGDIITEQNIHTLDVMNWIMDQDPLYAVGTGGRTVRPVGTCWDHFVVLFQYPDDVGITFSSRQFEGHGTTPQGIRNRMFGTQGVLETEYGGQVLVRGKNFYRGGRSPGIFKDGAVANIATFHDDILNGNHANPTVEPSVRSNLITVLGRTAAYTGERVTWKQLLESDEKLETDLSRPSDGPRVKSQMTGPLHGATAGQASSGTRQIRFDAPLALWRIGRNGIPPYSRALETCGRAFRRGRRPAPSDPPHHARPRFQTPYA